VLPQRTLIERGYKGAIYQTHGIATPEFIRLGGKDVEGTLFPTQPVVVARTLPADDRRARRRWRSSMHMKRATARARSRSSRATRPACIRASRTRSAAR
jgi:ABC-type branched-subunit amino acid transport system substrate-binding protein